MTSNKLLNNITSMSMENLDRTNRDKLFSDKSSCSSRNNNNMLTPSNYVIIMSGKCTKMV